MLISMFGKWKDKNVRKREMIMKDDSSVGELVTTRGKSCPFNCYWE